MRLKKKEALEQAQKNFEKRKKLLEGANNRYLKAIERLQKAELALSKPAETTIDIPMSTGKWNPEFNKEIVLSDVETKEMGY